MTHVLARDTVFGPMSSSEVTRRGRVEVVSGALTGLLREFDEALTIGRRDDNDLALTDDQVSRIHAQIRRQDDAYVIEDLGSRLGTTVDGQPIVDTTLLTPGCTVRVGKTILRFSTFLVEPDTTPQAQAYDPPTIEARRFIALPRLTRADQQTLDLKVVQLDHTVASDNLDAKNESELRRAGKHLQTLLLANRIISTEVDTEQLLERILDALFETFSVHRAVICTLNDDDTLNIRATRTKRKDQAQPQISSTIAYRALEERVGVLTHDASSDQRFDARQSIVDQNIRSAIAAPMIHRDKTLGVIYLDTVGIARLFSERDLDLLNGIASAAAGALDRASLVQRLKNTAAETIHRLAVAAEYRDDDTGFHIHRMSAYAAELARELGYDHDFCDNLQLAAPMHDVGKIGIPDHILKKPGRLTPEEFEIMKSHTTKGGAILAGSESKLLQMAHRIAMGHHEKFDGSGYPAGLEGEDIPIEGRIVAVADVFDALASKRCYKPAFDLDACFRMIEEGSGRHFDPAVVRALFDARSRILDIRDHYMELENRAEALGEEPSFENLWKRSSGLS